MTQYNQEYYRLADEIFLRRDTQILSDGSLSEYANYVIVIDRAYEESLWDDNQNAVFPQNVLGEVLSTLHSYSVMHSDEEMNPIVLFADLLRNNYEVENTTWVIATIII